MIEKSIRQYYSRGQLVKPGPGRPGYQGAPGGSHGSYGGTSSPYGGGGGDGRELAAQREAARQVAARQAERQAAAQREMQATIAAAEKAAVQQETISKNPVGGIDQFAKEMERLENAIPRAPGQTENISMTMPVSKMGGTLQDFYTNKN